MYVKMAFRPMNVGETFQRDMDIYFVDEKDIFIVIYLDDITLFYKIDEDHLFHLKSIFEKCRKFGIYLNPKKFIFSVEEGTLLGHIFPNMV